MGITEKYIVVYSQTTHEVIMYGVAGNTIITPHTVEQFNSETEMNNFIKQNDLKVPDD